MASQEAMIHTKDIKLVSSSKQLQEARSCSSVSALKRCCGWIRRLGDFSQFTASQNCRWIKTAMPELASMASTLSSRWDEMFLIVFILTNDSFSAISALWSCDFQRRLLIGRNFFIADLAYMSNSKTILPLVIFWFGHYFKKKFSENPLLGPVPQIFFKDP